MMVSNEGQCVGQRLTNKLLRKENGMKIQISLKIRRKSIPDNKLKLNWISPVRDCVRVNYNCHVNTEQECWDQSDDMHPPVCVINAWWTVSKSITAVTLT
jgi:hypothetical protein